MTQVIAWPAPGQTKYYAELCCSKDFLQAGRKEIECSPFSSQANCYFPTQILSDTPDIECIDDTLPSSNSLVYTIPYHLTEFPAWWNQVEKMQKRVSDLQVVWVYCEELWSCSVQSRKSKSVARTKVIPRGQDNGQKSDFKKHWTFIIAPALCTAFIAMAVVLGER